MSNIRLSTMLCFKGGLLDLRVRAPHIEIFGMLNKVNRLAEAFYRTVHLRGIWLRKL
jgi:hypothetical protein